MRVRRAAIAVSLAAALAATGAGTAAAGTDTSAPDDGSSGLLDTVGKTLSSLSGGSSGRHAEQKPGDNGSAGNQSAGQQSGRSGTAQTHSEDDTAAEEGNAFSEASGGTGADTAEGSHGLPGTGEGPLVDEQGLCADGSPQGNADSCESEILGNGYVNVCIRKDGGVVSQVGEATGLPEQAGLDCPTIERKPPPGGDDEGPRDDSEPTPMPPPLNRAQPAEPAEPIVAEPSFTG